MARSTLVGARHQLTFCSGRGRVGLATPTTSLLAQHPRTAVGGACVTTRAVKVLVVVVVGSSTKFLAPRPPTGQNTTWVVRSGWKTPGLCTLVTQLLARTPSRPVTGAYLVAVAVKAL